MDSKDFTGVVLAILVPVVTATLGALGVAFQDWRRSRTRLGRRKAMLEDARAQVGFVTEWWTASTSLSLSEDASAAATHEAMSLLARASSTVTLSQLPLPRSLPPLTLRRLALLYPFTSWAGRCVRAAFFVACGLTLVILGASVSQQLSPGPNQEGWVNADLAIGALVALGSLGLRFLAVEVEENASTAASRGETTWGFVGRVLLLYRFRHLPGRLVRILFYVALVGFGCYVVWAVEWIVFRWSLVMLPTYGATAVVLGLAVVGIRSWAVSLEPAHAAAPVTAPLSAPAATSTSAGAPAPSPASTDVAAPVSADLRGPSRQGAGDVAHT
jgi:hypothetical protein